MNFRSLDMALEHEKPSQVTTLDLSNQNLSELPTEIGKLTNLRVLNLEHNNLSELPEEIGELKNLTTLIINSNRLKTLPYSMKKLTNLMKLEIKRNELAAFPDIFENMSNLRGIYAKKNRLNSLPTSFKFLTNLQVLDVRQNGFIHLPSVIFSLPHLDNIRGILSEAQTSAKEIIASFNFAFNKTDLDADLYRDAFAILTDETYDLNLSGLLMLMLINFTPLRSKIMEKILTKSQNQPLTNKSSIAVLGNTSIQKQEIKSKLKELGIGYEIKITPKTTHIVLGNVPKLAGEIDDKQTYTIWLEKDLNNYFETVDKPYLLEIDDETTEQKEQLGRLLLSVDSSNVALAIQILKGGGVPENLIEELFLAYKICEDAKVKIDIKKLLQINTSPSVMDALSKRDILFDPKKINPNYRSESIEKELYKALKKYSSYTNDLDWNKIAFIIQENFGYGARYIFSNSPENSELRLKIMEQNLQGSILDFNKIYSKGQPDLTHPYTYPYYIPRPIPSELFSLTQLTELNLSGCYFAALPNEIENLQELEYLNLSNNFISKLPANIGLLKNLKVLNISQNEFKNFPTEISQLPNLEKCIIKNNRKKWEEKPIIIPDEIKQQMPFCTFEN